MSVRRVVGTGEDCDLRIHDAEYMSKRHFVIQQADDGLVTVEDLGSTNGTHVFTAAGWVRAYGPVPIGPGSKIHAGRVLFKIGHDGHVDVTKDVDAFGRDRV